MLSKEQFISALHASIMIKRFILNFQLLQPDLIFCDKRPEYMRILNNSNFHITTTKRKFIETKFKNQLGNNSSTILYTV